MPKAPKLVIIDGNAVFHRAYHALPPLSTPSGEPINAAYGFTMILLKVLADLAPSHITVAFDMQAPTIRHKEYEAYKAHRKPPPEDLYIQLPNTKRILDALKIKYFELEGFEADDIIGTFCEQNKEIEKVIVTGDMDELQLVDKKTKVYTMKRGFSDTYIYGEDEVLEKFGFGPERVIDFKALRGDPSDNIPGVRGVGEKTATDLIKQHGSLENIYKNIDSVPETVQVKLKTYKDDAFFSKKLVTIIKDVKIKYKLDELTFGKFNKQDVAGLFIELGFKSLINKMPKTDALDTPEEPRQRNHLTKAKYALVEDFEQLQKILSTLSKSEFVVVDTETDTLDAVTPKLLGIALSAREGEAFYVSLKLDLDSGSKMLQLMKPFLEQGPKKIGHNIKYDHMVLAHYGIDLGPIHFDTMLASYILDPTKRAYSLDASALSELGVEMIPIEELIGKGKNQVLMSQVPITKLSQYASEDADMTFRLFQKYKVEIGSSKLAKVLEDIETPLIRVLSKMERRGIIVSKEFLAKMSKSLGSEISKLENQIHKSVGYEFNIASPLQLKEALFGKLALDAKAANIKKIKTGLSTAASELTKLKGLHPVIDMVFDFREMVKLKNTYVDALPELINKKTGRVHTSFNQTIAATGRLSSSNPNLQNIPIRTELGEQVRAAFTPSAGSVFVSADYSQIELRIAAHLSSDKALIQIFKDGEDVHVSTAAIIFKTKKDKVDIKMRRYAKTVNFGVLYGMSSFGLSESTDMSRTEAADFITNYFAAFPRLAAFLEETKESARKLGYVETIFGRRRPVPEIHAPNAMIRAAAERAAINMPLQGSNADIIKLAMIGIDRVLPDLSMLIQVHDELLFEMPSSEISESSTKIRDVMEGITDLKVPIVVDLRVGENWKDLKPIK